VDEPEAFEELKRADPVCKDEGDIKTRGRPDILSYCLGKSQPGAGIEI
jgi:hypothetical protein